MCLPGFKTAKETRASSWPLCDETLSSLKKSDDFVYATVVGKNEIFSLSEDKLLRERTFDMGDPEQVQIQLVIRTNASGRPIDMKRLHSPSVVSEEYCELGTNRKRGQVTCVRMKNNQEGNTSLLYDQEFKYGCNSALEESHDPQNGKCAVVVFDQHCKNIAEHDSELQSELIGLEKKLGKQESKKKPSPKAIAKTKNKNSLIQGFLSTTSLQPFFRRVKLKKGVCVGLHLQVI